VCSKSFSTREENKKRNNARGIVPLFVLEGVKNEKQILALNV